MYVRIIRRHRKSKDRQQNGQSKKRTNHDLQNATQKVKDRTT